ncbi:unnamed protein product [Caenorhabditis nigoni]
MLPDLESRNYARESFEKVYGNMENLSMKIATYSIMTSLNHGLDYMSARTLQMQRRLFWALAIQTVIPIIVSFMPTVFVLYGAAFGFDVFGLLDKLGVCNCYNIFPISGSTGYYNVSSGSEASDIL